MRRLLSVSALLCWALLPHLSFAQQSEREILLEFYKETGGSSWDQNYGWEENSSDLCDWYGVVCVSEEDESSTSSSGSTRGLSSTNDNPGIKMLSLKNNNLSGRTPVSLYKLPQLETLYLSYNNNLDVSFLGSQYASSLSEVKIHSTATSSIAGISNLARTLQSLHMSGNTKLGGGTQLPPDLFQLSQLTSLHMAECNFEGTIPTTISNLSKLQQFNVLNNKLSGRIPASLSELTDLEILILSQNEFTGWIPEFLQELPSLQELFLDNNELTGELLPFNSQQELELLFLNVNSLTGSIPDGFLAGLGDSVTGVRVDLSGNQLTGTVPASLDRLESKSVKLLLADNQLTSIDSSLCDNSRWMDGHVNQYGCDAILCPPYYYSSAGRSLPGNVCTKCVSSTTAFLGTTTCQSLNLDERSILTQLADATNGVSNWYRKDNWLDDSQDVCDWYGIDCYTDSTRAGKIRHITLDNNGLNGTIPFTIWMLEHLQSISVSWNPVQLPFDHIKESSSIRRINIAATLTTSFDGIENSLTLGHLQADMLRLSGTLPEEILQIANLETLSMAECGLSSELDESISSLSNLYELYLYGNSLRGQIPSFEKLSNLKIVSLANNAFTGTLPESFETSLNDLEALSLTDQTTKGGGISGQVLSFAESTELKNLMLGRNKLEGTIPGDLLRSADSSAALLVDLSDNLLTGVVPGSLSRFDRMDIQLENNYFTEIDDRLCAMDDWMSGSVREFGCDAILCPSHTTTDKGRRMYDSIPCDDCGDDSSVQFLGQTQCEVREPLLTERIALQLLFDNAGGFGWRNSKNWYSEDAHICDWYGIACDDAKSVVSISLGGNDLRGHVPTQLYRLPNLERLALFGNDVVISFDGIENANHLKHLIVDSTGLTSLEGIDKARSLKELNVRSNKLSGTFPKEIQNLVRLESLEIGNNQISGPLPHWLGQLPNLAGFIASNNAISGPLVDFAGFNNLVHLDISRNKITGTVPVTFLSNSPSKMKVFADLSNNKIGGTLPFDLERMERLTILLKDNEIEAIDSSLCSVGGWNDYDVQAYGCDGILCAIGTSASSGRQISDELPCEPCQEAEYMGSTKCHSSAMRHLLSASVVGLFALTGMLML